MKFKFNGLGLWNIGFENESDLNIVTYSKRFRVKAEIC